MRRAAGLRTALGIALLAAAVACPAAMEISAAAPVAQVLECVGANAPRELSVYDLRIEARGAGIFTPFLAGRFYSRRDERGLRALLHITAPADLAGSRYLRVEDGDDDALYLYLPALDKVRRVSGIGAESEIAGTTLDYAALRLLGQALRVASITLDRPSAVTVLGREAQALRFVPAVADSPYRRVLVAVDRKTCVILRADFQDAAGSVKLYEVEPDSLRRSGAHTYASRVSIEDRARGSRVRISLGDVTTSPKLPARRFDPKRFHRAE